jgi:hypothetical protein
VRRGAGWLALYHDGTRGAAELTNVPLGSTILLTKGARNHGFQTGRDLDRLGIIIH